MSDCNCHDPTLLLGSDTDTVTVPGPETVTRDYGLLENKPSIEGVTLEGDRTFEDLGLYEAVYSKEAVDEAMSATAETVQGAVQTVASLSQEVKSVTEKEEASVADIDDIVNGL